MKKDICKGCKWYDEKLGCKNRSLAKLYQYIREETNMDRLIDLMHRRVAYIMTDEPEKTYTGTVERDSYERPYIQDETDAAVIVYDTGTLQTVKEE